MTADYSVTIRALPLLMFFFKEFINAFVSNVFQVLNHAHVVFGSVTLVEGFKPATGEVLAFITKPYKSFPNQVTIFFHENTVLATWQATGTVSLLESFLVQIISKRQVVDAHAAIHSARSDEFFVHSFAVNIHHQNIPCLRVAVIS